MVISFSLTVRGVDGMCGWMLSSGCPEEAFSASGDSVRFKSNIKMKPLIVILTGILCSVSGVHAATVQALFTAQTQGGDPEGVTGATGAVSANTFPTIPTLTRTGTGQVNAGGESGYVDFQGKTWLGSGNQNTPGHSFGWNPGASGVSLTVTLNLVDLQDLTIRMAIRSAASGGATPVSAFSAIEYSLDGGTSFETAASGASLDITTGTGFNEYNLDLTTLSAIENQADVQIRFSVPDVATNTSFRMDNILLTAQTIPEPSAAISAVIALGVIGLRRRRA